jgi:4-guanidinobutyraldehyde dehydrogenase / NAD-dependent aldehyde dehydrogenase
LAQREIFGPVLAVIAFDEETDALRIANKSKYGLAAGVWTNELGDADAVKRCGLSVRQPLYDEIQERTEP